MSSAETLASQILCDRTGFDGMAGIADSVCGLNSVRLPACHVPCLHQQPAVVCDDSMSVTDGSRKIGCLAGD
jgi:hypothetical protein